jgi:predicted nuclease of predicted toxin-antitoxin system
VKLLFDQNLSRKLVREVEEIFPGSSHVTTAGLETATDREVWQYAGEHGYAVVSKDSDFRQLAFLYGPPPKVIWLRIGNASTTEVLQLILDHAEALGEFDRTEEGSLLVIPRLPS